MSVLTYAAENQRGYPKRKPMTNNTIARPSMLRLAEGSANYVFIDGHTETLTKAKAEDRANSGRTGVTWKREHFFLPFAHPTLTLP